MDLPAVGCLALLWPALPQTFADDALRQVLSRGAATLPAIPRLALELRLAESDAAVDLHQLVTSHPEDLEALERHFARGGRLGQGGETVAFLRQWIEDADLRREIGEIFLEWDQPDGNGDLGAPAIFLPIDRKGPAEDDRNARRKVVLAVLQRLGVEWQESDETVFGAFGPPISISHIGVMLGRRSCGLRINYRGVPRGGLENFLRALQWPGDVGRAAEEFDILVDLSDRVTVALDFDGRLGSRIGFELLLDGQPVQEPRWRALLRRFETMGVCSAAKAEALLAAPDVLSPEQADQPWPAAWIIAAVRSAPDCRPWFDRRLSHLKLTLADDGAATAKAYLSGQHHWKPVDPNGAVGATAEASREIAEVVEAAVDFLLNNRRQNGLWNDFRIANGSSDDWVSAFVACALAAAGARGRRAAIEAAARLAERQRSGGWGYNAFSPPDADSTAWVLKLLAGIGDSAAEAHPARAFLLGHLGVAGTFATYAPATPLTFDRGGSIDDAGWRSSHACVAANAAGVLGQALWPLLIGSQEADGSWISYWWKTDAMATALAAEALSDAAPDAAERAVAWGRDMLTVADPNAFDLAWLVRLLMLGEADDRAAARAAARRLADLQLADGSFPAGAQMLFPEPAVLARRGDAAVYVDEFRLFTTAAAVAALRQVHQADTK